MIDQIQLVFDTNCRVSRALLDLTAARYADARLG